MWLFISVQHWLITVVAIFTGNWYDDDDDEQYLIVYFLAEGWRCFTTATSCMEWNPRKVGTTIAALLLLISSSFELAWQLFTFPTGPKSDSSKEGRKKRNRVRTMAWPSFEWLRSFNYFLTFACIKAHLLRRQFLCLMDYLLHHHYHKAFSIWFFLQHVFSLFYI